MSDDLDGLLAAAATDPARRPAFTRALLDGEIYVLGTVDRPAGSGTAPAHSGVTPAASTMQLVGLSNADGSVVPPDQPDHLLRAIPPFYRRGSADPAAPDAGPGSRLRRLFGRER